MAYYNMNQNWHSSRTFNDEVLKYHDKYARQPNVTREKERLESLKLDIKSQMNDIGTFTCLEFKYKDSTYEGVKIMQSERDCPEFDLDFVIKGGEYLVADNSQPSWHKLRMTDGASNVPPTFRMDRENSPLHDSSFGLDFARVLYLGNTSQQSWHTLRVKDGPLNVPVIIRMSQENGVLSPKKILESFCGSLSKCAFIKNYNIKLRYHWPAMQMDVHYPFSKTLWFQVDLAPAFYLEGNNPNERFSECYVAKSPDDKNHGNMWYRSYSTDEKRLLDKAGGFRKVVLRTLKAMRANSPQLLGLQSYHFKMALFHVMDKYPYDYDWTTDKTGQRLISILAYIQNCLFDGEMPNYFNKDLNILKLGYDARCNLRNRITKLIENDQRMIDFLRSRETNLA